MPPHVGMPALKMYKLYVMWFARCERENMPPGKRCQRQHSANHIYVWHYAEHPALWVYRCRITHVFSRPFWVILGGCTLDAACPKCIILFADVTSLNDAVTSYVMSWHHTYIGHVTFYYKRLPMPRWGVLACCSFDSITRDLCVAGV